MKVLQDLLQRIRTFVTDMWTRTSNRDRLRYLVIAVIAVVLIVGALVMLNTGKYQEVASNADSASLAQMSSTLQDAGISSKASNNGTSLLVDKNDYLAAIAAIAQSTAVSSEINYTVYSNATGIMSTAADKEFFEKSQTEAWLRDVLRSFDGVSDARVLLNLKDNKKSIYQSEIEESSASVTLFFNQGANKSQNVITSVAAFISNAVGIKPENVTILDESMQNLNQEPTDYTTIQQNEEFRQHYNKDIAESVKKLLIPSLGESHVQVNSFATLNFDDIETNSVEFSPVVEDEGIPRSLQEITETATGGYPNGENPGTDPNGAGDTYTGVEGQYSSWESINRTVNYEINQINKNIVEAKGSLEDLTLSLTVDSNKMENNAANIALLQSVAGGAVGLAPADFANKIQVNFLPFDEIKTQQDIEDQIRAAESRQNLFSFLQVILLYVVIGACVVLLVWRTLSLFKPQSVEVPEDHDYLVGDLAEYGDLVDAAVQSMELEVIKTPSRERVEEFIENNPEAVANMLRSWLADEGERGW